MSTNIAAIVDYSAQVAASIQDVRLYNGETIGVRAVFGTGQGLYTDPLHPGEYIQPAPENPDEPYTHVSDLPDTPAIEYVTQSGLVSLEWTVPMSLIVNRGTLATLRQTMMPFYGPYLAAFLTDPTLGGLCEIAYIKNMRLGPEDQWDRLFMDLLVHEEVHFP